MLRSVMIERRIVSSLAVSALCIVAPLLLVFFFETRSAGADDVTTTTSITICGDAVVSVGELCDSGTGSNTGAYGSSTAERYCAPGCASYGPYCGDAVLQVRFTEECDDGDNTSGDLCSATCEEEAPAPLTVSGAPAVGLIPSDSGTKGQISAAVETKVILRGKAYPNSTVSILLDSVLIGSVLADSNADFLFSAVGLTPGTATFSFYAKDRRGVESITSSTIFEVVEQAITTVANIFLPPTIQLSAKQVEPGALITASGQSVPLSKVVTQINPGEKTNLEASADRVGDWALQVDTASLPRGYHSAKSYFQLSETSKSGFGRSLSFYVGTEAPPGEASSDINGDKKINLVDFSIFLLSWGTDDPKADFNDDGAVNLADFSIMLFAWTG